VILKPKAVNELPAEETPTTTDEPAAKTVKGGDVALEWNGFDEEENESNDNDEVEGEDEEGEERDESAEEWSHSEDSDEDGDDSVAEVARRLSKKQRNAINRKKREARPLYVQQDLRGVVTKPKVLGDDKREEAEDVEAEAIAQGAEDTNSDDHDDQPEDSGPESALEPNAELKWDDVLSAAIRAPREALQGERPDNLPKSEKSKGKQRELAHVTNVISGPTKVEGHHLNDVVDAHKLKEARMKTNKRKVENFYTHANVKNRNREKKVPQAPGKRDERGKNGNRKAGGRGNRKR